MKRIRFNTGKFWMGAPLLSLGLLVAVGFARGLFQENNKYLALYREQVRQSVQSIPAQVPGWSSQDVEAPEPAAPLTRPNALLCRRYVETQTGKEATFLFLHSHLSGDIFAYFPPACYAARGWTQVTAKPREWTVEGETVRGTAYIFERQSLDGVQRIWVHHFLASPTGITAGSLAELKAGTSTDFLFTLGAVEVLIETGPMEEPLEREGLVEALLKTSFPAVRSICSIPVPPGAGIPRDGDRGGVAADGWRRVTSTSPP